MSSWPFNLFMDKVVREMKASVGNAEEMKIGNTKWKLNTILFAGDATLLGITL